MIHGRLKLLVPAFILILTTTQVASGAELPQELLNCRAMPTDAARLDCYDQLVDAHTGSTSQSAKTDSVVQLEPVAVAPAATTAAAGSVGDISQEELFGKNPEEVRQSVQEATGTKEIDRIEARVTEVLLLATGKVIIILDNGQVWKQKDRSKLRLSGDEQVIIRRASFGSFLLTKVGSKTPMRVKRIS